MSLISAGLLPLAQPFTGTFFIVDVPDSIVDSAHAVAKLEIVDSLVDGGPVITEDANRMQGGQICKIPLYQSVSEHWVIELKETPFQ
jgi:hypothetical protein